MSRAERPLLNGKKHHGAVRSNRSRYLMFGALRVISQPQFGNKRTRLQEMPTPISQWLQQMSRRYSGGIVDGPACTEDLQGPVQLAPVHLGHST